MLVLATGQPLAAQSQVPQAALSAREGFAYSLKTGELVYRELHDPHVEAGRLIGDDVTYLSADGELIARKRVDYRGNALLPEFRLDARNTGYVEGLKRLDGDRIEIYHRKGADASVRRERMEAPAGLVADAGFDVLIYQRLQALQAGEELVFPFAVPSRLDTLDFRLRKLDSRQVLGEPATVVRMEPASVWVRWLVDPIDVAYHRHTGALLRYEGVSNLPDPDGDGNYRVRIDFPPPGAEPRPPEP